ncbi:exosortase-associated protein EpsI, B-type [Thiobacillus sp.]|uniref:exosortase-associated protein EpsI, B-type n=1 Tax=Thiobacillus sp. TaxID=924 RepID=UPI0018523A3D|nr:exosortase-associated protein EpsI, B-type [Thiobacillus sp.]MBC2732585.1 EpsI family protein [Thiobacillus sp.]MBC2741322.1 EpsI family protein [Thiobacillus sp.]MBC2759099.1 EpsI family protein [Thiobacillus sp.]
MKLISFRHLVIGLCMFAAAGMALALKPTVRIVDSEPRLDLETLIPRTFGDWKIDETIVPLISNPEQQALIKEIYSQTLTRTYVNSNGEHIMLSIAYGGDQSDNMAVHKPEICYPAQGFQILKNPTISSFATGEGSIPVKRLVATQGRRIEPITYWTTVGDTVAVNGLKWKLQQLKYGLTGKIPDGLLFRISSIQADDTKAYHIQDAFTRDLLKAMSPDGRQRIIGHPAAAS